MMDNKANCPWFSGQNLKLYRPTASTNMGQKVDANKIKILATVAQSVEEHLRQKQVERTQWKVWTPC